MEEALGEDLNEKSGNCAPKRVALPLAIKQTVSNFGV